jgi:hypothetical protein
MGMVWSSGANITSSPGAACAAGVRAASSRDRLRTRFGTAASGKGMIDYKRAVDYFAVGDN